MAHLAHLDVVVMEVRDNNVPTGVDGGVVRPSELVQLRAPRSKLCEDFSGWLENVNTRTLVVNNNQLTSVGHGHALGTQELGAGHLHDKLAVMLVY